MISRRALLVHAAMGSTSVSGQAAAQALRDSFDMHVPVAPSPVAVAGEIRLAYEIHLTNFSRENLSALGLSVLDSVDGFVIAKYEREALANRLVKIGPP